MEMDERKQKILMAIIHDYIATAEPVGSRTIARKYELGVSPATIRNEMSDLEEMGYIEQPHTSSGRIPSDIGYRYYVDCLMERHQLDQAKQSYIRTGFDKKGQEIADVLRQTGNLLSQLTNYTSITLDPMVENPRVKQVSFVPMDRGKALAIVVMESGIVHSRMLDLPEHLSAEDLNSIAQVLNARLQGVNSEDIQRTLISEIYFELAKYKEISNIVMELLQTGASLSIEDRVHLSGTLNILNQPEFRNIDKVKTLLSLLDQSDVLLDLLKSAPQDGGISIRIGGENKISGIQDCSMVTATYHIDGKVMGSIGLLGPTRMDYSKVVSIMEFMSVQLSDVLRKIYYGR